MPITSDTSSPLFAVVGATGTLGGSVIKALQAPSRSYRVRGICRNITSPAAKELESIGVQLISADVSTADGVKKAFENADIVFSLTLTNYSLATPQDVHDTEVQLGKHQMDGAAQAGVKIVVWSGLSNHNKYSSSKHPVKTFDCKAAVTEYGRSLNKFRLIDVQPGTFASNYWGNSRPRAISDDTYALFAPMAGDSLLPICDIQHDYGRYVVAAVEQDGEGLQTVYTGAYVPFKDIAAALAEVSGKKVQFILVKPEQYEEQLASAAGPTMAFCLREMYVGIEHNGYYCGADVKPSLEIVGGIRSFRVTLETNKEQVMALFAQNT